ncbi:cell division protein FtsZ [Candidatus Micrarchaeota archaeon]|nr:cell division protein FtsZ [Candidatus Micrarchaeota archaeon]MBD3417934.1 cell division protein FtsZ [Candidatus Micrarchaeota archaeon]
MLDGIVKDIVSEKEAQKKREIAPVFEEKPEEKAEENPEDITLPTEEKPSEAEETPKNIEENSSIRIKVVGVGGAGCNSVNRITKHGIKSAKTLAVNTDKLHLGVVEAHGKHLLGRTVTKGLGSGGDPKVAAKAADSDKEDLRRMIGENEIVFVCAGMGGGTGTGASPLIAQLAREQGATVIGVVTYPFKIERSRIHRARDGLKELMKNADTVIVIENDKLLSYAPNLPIDKAFALADEIASRAVRGISDLVVLPSMMNVDYADVRAIMKDGGIAMISVGKGSGTGAGMVESVVSDTRNNPLLEVSYEGAKGALIHVAGPGGLTLGDATQICMGISDDFHEEAEVKMGARIDEGLSNAIEVTAVITGVKAPHLFEEQKPQDEMQSEILGSLL